MRKLNHSLCCLLLCWSASAVASDGVLEINQDCVASGCFPGDTAGFPVTLVSGGAYRLTSNLSVDTANNGITIQTTDPVDLDLGGFTIDGGGSCTGTPVTACTAGPGISGVAAGGMQLRLHGGTVRGFSNSNVLLNPVNDGSVIEDLMSIESTATGFASVSLSLSGNGRTIILRHVTVSRNRAIGMLTSGSNAHVVLDGVVVTGNGAAGANLGTSSTVTDCVFHRNAGLAISSSGLVIALGNTTFFGNNGSSTAAQFAITTLLNLGGVACEDASCP